MRGSRPALKQGDRRSADRLRAAGLRPTKQRVALANLLFKEEDRHLTAGVRVSLATIYNTLHQFTEAHLLKQVAVDAGRSYFDTNVHEHQHFYVEDEGMLIDIPGASIEVAGVPAAPKGMTVDRVDVVVRLRRN
jgi:Fur family iron response transcriptional regulator